MTLLWRVVKENVESESNFLNDVHINNQSNITHNKLFITLTPLLMSSTSEYIL